MSPLFVPGPVDVERSVADAQTAPMLPHRSKEFETIFHRAEGNARKVFFTQNRIILTASSGTGLQEAAVRNFVKDRVLACVNGAFGSRWHDVARANGKEVTRLETDWNRPVLPVMVAESLKSAHHDAVLIVHNETSTGLENPVKEIAAAVQDVSPETLICVDAVSSLGGTRIEMDAWGLDMLLTSSQKSLALPPGLGLAGVSDRALAFAESVPDRGWYFDLVMMENYRVKNSTPATPAISLIYALDLQLRRMLAEGLDARFERHANMARRAHEWAESRDLALFAPEGFRSKTVTTVDNQLGLDVADLNSYLLAREMRIANGYGPLKGKTFRIAHMGETTLAHMDMLLEAIDSYLKR